MFSIFQTNHDWQRKLAQYFLFYALFFLTVVASHYQYADDRMRSFYGYFYWDVDGRFFTYYLIDALTLGDRVLDIWPLGQVASLAIMSLLTFVMVKFTAKLSPNVSAVLFFPIFANVFYLENISYIYDSVSMTASVAFSVLSALLVASHKKENRFTRPILSVVFLISALLFYQASLNIYFCVLCFYYMYMVVNGGSKSIVFGVMRGGLVSIISYFSYKATINLLSDDGYKNNRSEIIGSDGEFFSSLLDNFMRMHSLASDWMGGWLVAVTLAIVSVSIIVSLRKVIFSEVDHKAIRCLSVILLYACAAFFVYGVVAMIKNTAYSPRIIMSLGVVVSGSALITHVLHSSRVVRFLNIFLVSIFLFSSFKVSLVFGNALSSQKDYEESMLYDISRRINMLSGETGINNLVIAGKLPYAPFAKQAANQSEIIDKMVIQVVDDDWRWINKSLYTFGMNYGINFRLIEEVNKECLLYSPDVLYVCDEEMYLNLGG